MMNNPGVMAILRAREGLNTRPPQVTPITTPGPGPYDPKPGGGGASGPITQVGSQQPQNQSESRADRMRRLLAAAAQANGRVRSGNYMRQPATGPSTVQPAGMSAQSMGNNYGTASVPIPDQYGNGGGGGY